MTCLWAHKPLLASNVKGNKTIGMQVIDAQAGCFFIGASNVTANVLRDVLVAGLQMLLKLCVFKYIW